MYRFNPKFTLFSGLLIFLFFFFSSCKKEPLITDLENSGIEIRTGTSKIGELKFAARVFLDGSYEASLKEMRTDLYDLDLIPQISPYGRSDSMRDIGPVVDWVEIQLRDVVNPKIIIESKSGLLRNNGDIVDEKGDSILTFTSAVGNSYYVTINHRNHLGVMTGEPIYFPSMGVKTTTPLVDFTDTTTVIFEGNHPSAKSQLRRHGDHMALWAGDACRVGIVSYQGPGNGLSCIYLALPLGNVNYVLEGYHNEDVNMDGRVIFQGPNNDVVPILIETVLSHPGNSGGNFNHLVIEAIP